MRQPQQNKRMRGRGRKPSNSGNRVLESNGPDVKIRGSASHIAEKYVTLARDAQVSGDRIVAENYLQHAEHFFRIVAATQSQNQNKNEQPKVVARSGNDADNSAHSDQSNNKQPSEQKAAVENRPSGDENQNNNDRPPKSRGRRRKPDAVAESEQPVVGKQENKSEVDARDSRPTKKARAENGADNSTSNESAMAANAAEDNVVEAVAADPEGGVEPKTASDSSEPVEAV